MGDLVYGVVASGRGIRRGVGGVKPVDVGQQDKLVGADGDRDLRCQPVVVSVPDFVRGNGVVFVDNRNDIQPDQLLQCGPAVQVPPAV